MQKVYLLLRSNRQTGPYSLEELLQLDLKPFDLVWVDGRSAAWQYPFEIPALKPYVPETPHAEVPFQPIATEAMEEKQAPGLSFQQPQNPIPQKAETPKRVFVSIPKTYTAAKEQKTSSSSYEPQMQVPGTVAEHKAYMPTVDDALSQRQPHVGQSDPSHLKTPQRPVTEESVSTNYSRSLHDVEEDYTKWIYRQKAKKKVSLNPRDLLLAVLLVAVIGGGYYVMSKPSITNSLIPTNKTVVPATSTAEQLPEETEPKEILSPEQRVVANPADIATNARQKEPAKNSKTKNPHSTSKTQTVQSLPRAQDPIPVEKTTPDIHEGNNDVNPEPAVKQQPKETTEKKKKLAEVFKGIFAKKDKNEEPVNGAPASQDPKPSINRQASRRDESANTKETTKSQVSSANLMEQVDLSSNAPDNWMLGVKNLKIILRNRSNVTIQSASVAVSYFDENNQLLDKKIIYFSNIAPKAKASVAAPDSKFADHVDYKLTSISAKEDRFASN